MDVDDGRSGANLGAVRAGALGVIHSDEVRICESCSWFVRGDRDAVRIKRGKARNRFVRFAEIDLKSRSTLAINDRMKLVLFVRIRKHEVAVLLETAVAARNCFERLEDFATADRCLDLHGVRVVMTNDSRRVPRRPASEGSAFEEHDLVVAELTQVCDVRIAAEGAKLGQPEIKLGIIPGSGRTQRLPNLVGEGQALRLIFSGELIDAT